MRKHMRRVTFKVEYGMTWGWYCHFRELFRRFKKGDDATAQKVTETLRAMDEDGFVQELCEKYADQGISYENWCLE